MSKYLIKTTEQYRVDSEEECQSFIEQQKQEFGEQLTKYASDLKEVKSKGEIIDSYKLLTLTKVFQAAKEPDTQIKVVYDFD